MINKENLLRMKKVIEDVNKHIKENPSKFVEVNNKNVTNFNSVKVDSEKFDGSEISGDNNNENVSSFNSVGISRRGMH